MSRARRGRSIESRCFMPGPPRGRRSDDRHLVDPVELLDAHVDALGARGREVLADVVGADRKLAVAAVDQHGELDRARAGRSRRARRSPRARCARCRARRRRARPCARSSAERQVRGVHHGAGAARGDSRRGRRRCRCRRAAPRPRAGRRRAGAGGRRAAPRDGGCRRARPRRAPRSSRRSRARCARACGACRPRSRTTLAFGMAPSWPLGTGLRSGLSPR